MKLIEIVVSPTGQTTVQTKGFRGATCQDASRFMEQALGQRSGEQKTAEFFYQPQSDNQVARESH